jgi:hypothetical protein
VVYLPVVVCSIFSIYCLRGVLGEILHLLSTNLKVQAKVDGRMTIAIAPVQPASHFVGASKIKSVKATSQSLFSDGPARRISILGLLTTLLLILNMIVALGVLPAIQVFSEAEKEWFGCTETDTIASEVYSADITYDSWRQCADEECGDEMAKCPGCWTEDVWCQDLCTSFEVKTVCSEENPCSTGVEDLAVCYYSQCLEMGGNAFSEKYFPKVAECPDVPDSRPSPVLLGLANTATALASAIVGIVFFKQNNKITTRSATRWERRAAAFGLAMYMYTCTCTYTYMSNTHSHACICICVHVHPLSLSLCALNTHTHVRTQNCFMMPGLLCWCGEDGKVLGTRLLFSHAIRLTIYLAFINQ